MSDTRDEAQQELVEAGMASGLEDALGVSDHDQGFLSISILVR
jgi:hypothetical protein